MCSETNASSSSKAKSIRPYRKLFMLIIAVILSL